MRKFLIALLTLAAVLAITPAARAESVLFNLSGGGISTTGTITLGAELAPGAYEIAGITGTFSDANLGISSMPIGSMVPGYGTPFGGTLTSADGSWYYDNLVFSPGTPTFDSWGGPLYNLGVDEVNIWSVGGSTYEVGVSLTGATQDYLEFEYVTGTFETVTGLSAAPEPSSLLLLGSGLLAMAGGLRRRVLAGR